jgi:flagellar hook-associated protein 2
LPTTLAEAESPSSPSLAASDSTLFLDGVEVQRSTNQVSDVIDGVTLNLLSLTGNQSAVVTIARDTAPIKEKIRAIVDNYNDLQSILDAAFDRESKVENLGGSLVGDSSVRALRDQMRRIMLPDGATMGSGSAQLSNLRQLGLMIDTDGKMKFASLKTSASPGESLINMGDEAVLDRALAQRFDEVANLFAGPGGLAKDMSDRISGSGIYVDSTFSPSSPKKILNALSLNAGQRITADKQRLVDLERRMEQLLDRYTRQFSVMESLVGESKATRTGVENSFKGMSYSRS